MTAHYRIKAGQIDGEIVSIQIGPNPVHLFNDNVWQLHQDTLRNSKNVISNKTTSCIANLRSYFTKSTKQPRLLALCDRKFTSNDIVDFGEYTNLNEFQSIKSKLQNQSHTGQLNFSNCPRNCFLTMPVWPDNSSMQFDSTHCEPVMDRIRLQLEDCDIVSQIRISCSSSQISGNYWNYLFHNLVPNINDELSGKLHISPIDSTVYSIRNEQTIHYLLLTCRSLSINASVMNIFDPVSEHIVCSAHTQPMDYLHKEIACPGLIETTSDDHLPPRSVIYSIDRHVESTHMGSFFDEIVPGIGGKSVKVFISDETGSSLQKLVCSEILKNMPQCWRDAIRRSDQEECNVINELTELYETLDWYKTQLSL